MKKPAKKPLEEIPEDERVYIPEAAELLDRRIGTLRKWEADDVLPANLMPRRGKRRWRYWSQEQIDLIRAWMIDTDRRPGRMRTPRAKRTSVAKTQDEE